MMQKIVWINMIMEAELFLLDFPDAGKLMYIVTQDYCMYKDERIMRYS